MSESGIILGSNAPTVQTADKVLIAASCLDVAAKLNRKGKNDFTATFFVKAGMAVNATIYISGQPFIVKGCRAGTLTDRFGHKEDGFWIEAVGKS